METAAIFKDNTPEDNEIAELQPPFLQETRAPLFSFLLEDTMPPLKEELSSLIEENNTGIENKIKKSVIQEDEELEEYAKDVTYESENFYIQKNPYAAIKDYERTDFLKPKEEGEEKSFLWK